MSLSSEEKLTNSVAEDADEDFSGDYIVERTSLKSSAEWRYFFYLKSE